MSNEEEMGGTPSLPSGARPFAPRAPLPFSREAVGVESSTSRNGLPELEVSEMVLCNPCAHASMHHPNHCRGDPDTSCLCGLLTAQDSNWRLLRCLVCHEDSSLVQQGRADTAWKLSNLC